MNPEADNNFEPNEPQPSGEQRLTAGMLSAEIEVLNVPSRSECVSDLEDLDLQKLLTAVEVWELNKTQPASDSSGCRSPNGYGHSRGCPLASFPLRPGWPDLPARKAGGVEQMKVIGIDPGTMGAVAILGGAELLLVADLPTTKQVEGGAASSQMVCAHALADLMRPHVVPGVGAALEVVIVKFPMSLIAARTVGMNYGVVLALLAGLGLGGVELAPHDWNKRLGLSDDKGASDSLALPLCPSARPQLTRHYRSEAALIARAGMLEMNGVSK